jgi:hypothetical protein
MRPVAVVAVEVLLEHQRAFVVDGDGADVRIRAVEHAVHDLRRDGARQRSSPGLADVNAVG